MNTADQITTFLKTLAQREGMPGFMKRGFSHEAYVSIVRLLAIDGKLPGTMKPVTKI